MQYLCWIHADCRFLQVVDNINDELEVWKGLSNDVDAGKEVFAPQPKSSKKRAGTNAGLFQKRLRTSGGFGIESDVNNGNPHECGDKHKDDSPVDSVRGQALTPETIATKIAALQNKRREARQSKFDLQDRIETLQTNHDQAQRAMEEMKAKIMTRCISGRNQYAKFAIQQDYAAGLKDIDQEIAAEEDEENFDPEDEVRDYDRVARELPVFCVSSRAYQYLKGRLRKDGSVRGFQDVSETEIPMLQKVLALCSRIDNSNTDHGTN